MNKRIISLCLALLLMLASASAAFSDIADSKLSQTASVLDALGIMQGVGGSRFDPGSALTRAQFCKLAVTAMGFTDVSAYGSYTIFPDVKNGHWAAQYINAAVRHPDLKKQSIIRGYADGTFGPDKTVSFGEACTMLLRMLGYTEEDIGPFWPADYIARAQLVGITEGVSITNPLGGINRGDAATMLLNTLGASMKGSESTLIDKTASSTVKNCILLATSETDATLAANEALFFENGAVAASPRKTAGTLDKSLIGVHGTVVIGKGSEKVVIGVVPNTYKTETFTVRSVAADRVSTDAQTLRPDADTSLYVARERAAGKYTEMWSSVQSGDTLTCYYDAYGALQLLAVLPTVSMVSDSTFVYGVATSVSIPQEYKIVKNGAQVDRSKLQKYDVVTLDAANKQALVSDARISGQYTAGGPTASYPQTVTLYGQSYTIPSNAAALFRDIRLKDYITLLFDTSGNVAAVYPRNMVSADMQGIVTGIKDTQATIATTNGLTIKVEIDTSDQNGTSGSTKSNDLVGHMVSIAQSAGGKAYLAAKPLTSRVNGSWSIADGKLGTSTVSPRVRVYEEVLFGAPLNAISVSDITMATVSSDQIRYTVTDSAGTVTDIVLGDVTGDSWVYGIGFDSSKNVNTENPIGKDEQGEDTYGTYTKHEVSLQHWDGSKTITNAYRVLSLTDRLNSTPIGVPKGYISSDDEAVISSLSTLSLTLVDTVDRAAFDGVSGVRTAKGYYPLADGIGVYATAQKEFISLQSAKNNYTTFRVYANKTAENGGKIRVIVAS